MELLDRHRRRLKRRGEGLIDLGDAHRHKARIEAKKLRYALDFLSSLYPGHREQRRLARFRDRLAVLQDNLGELNDLAMAPTALAALGIEMPPATDGKHTRKHLLRRADAAYHGLMRARRFWHD